MTKKEKTFLVDLGFNLRKIRNKKGWTLEYSDEQGTPSWQYLERLELGHHNITILTLRKIAIAYKVPLKDLIIEY